MFLILVRVIRTGFKQSFNSKSGIDKRLMNLPNIPVEDHHVHLNVADRLTLRFSLEVAPLYLAHLWVEHLVERMWDSEHEHAVLTEDTGCLRKAGPKVINHLKHPRRERNVERIVSERQFGYNASKEPRFDIVSVTEPIRVAELLSREINPGNAPGIAAGEANALLPDQLTEDVPGLLLYPSQGGSLTTDYSIQNAGELAVVELPTRESVATTDILGKRLETFIEKQLQNRLLVE